MLSCKKFHNVATVREYQMSDGLKLVKYSTKLKEKTFPDFVYEVYVPLASSTSRQYQVVFNMPYSL